MNINAYFTNIRDVVVNDIRNASESISIAVAWFTNHEIFNELLMKIKQGVKIKLIILNDDINLRTQSLDFQELINLGGELWLASAEHPMHHKFCIIDDKVLITGSYNYTYLADSINHENIVRFQGLSDIITDYYKEFSSLSQKEPVHNVLDYIRVNPPKINYYSFKNFRFNDINQYATELSQNGHIEHANKIIYQLETESLTENPNLCDFEITDVIYKHWQKEYYADKVTVTPSEIIVSFRSERNGDSWWIQGVGTPCSWIIEDVATKEIIAVSRISNVMINGILLIKELQDNTLYSFGHCKEAVPEELGLTKIEDNLYRDTNGKDIRKVDVKNVDKGSLTVDVTFPRKKDWENRTINFLEGNSTREKTNYWHCFGINLKLNRVYLRSK